jgi:hypothetical protein
MSFINSKKILLGLFALILAFSLLASPYSAGQVLASRVGNNVLAAGRVFYVTTKGSSSGDGSSSRPWSLGYALRNPAGIKPGDTIYVRSGVYNGSFTVTLNGSSSAWITVRAYPNERVTLRNSNSFVLDIVGSHYLNLWGLEIAGSESSRNSASNASAYGIRVNQGASSSNIRFINMVIHDMQAQGMGFWQALTNSELYGCLIYFNGTTKLDHGVYVHNTSGTKSLINNIIFDNASHGVHGYAETAEKGLNSIVLDGNTLFDNGSIVGTYKRNILMGGLTRTNNAVINGNMTYYPSSSGEALNIGYSAGSANARVTNNYFAGGSIVVGGGYSNLTMTGNYVYALGGISGIKTSSFAKNTWITARPTLAAIGVRVNKYETNRANLTIYNWTKASTVSIPASRLAGVNIPVGAHYELHNAQNFYGDVITGTYNGSSITVPMTGRSVAQPVAIGKPASTFPTFGAFVLIVR